ncbi:hypothetical protein CC78DRAFT_567956 [Lojkania enalia]|uniref:RING-type domain-containing protein n=1 Tax=Lojkania enalia TaxID=147567 RepID=A0A9P4KEH5_9PLEO|nr:hypothetical protein CC78DRAFT_567956 [Didymosphaeria enalia]
MQLIETPPFRTELAVIATMSIGSFFRNHTETVSREVAAKEDPCPICLESYTTHTPVRIKKIEGCKHFIGRRCLKTLLSKDEPWEKRCPYCRALWVGVEEQEIWQTPRAARRATRREFERNAIGREQEADDSFSDFSGTVGNVGGRAGTQISVEVGSRPNSGQAGLSSNLGRLFSSASMARQQNQGPTVRQPGWFSGLRVPRVGSFARLREEGTPDDDRLNIPPKPESSLSRSERGANNVERQLEMGCAVNERDVKAQLRLQEFKQMLNRHAMEQEQLQARQRDERNQFV